MASGSRFEELRRAKEVKVSMLSANVDDVIEQKRLEAELARVDSEIAQRVEEIQNEPVNTELILQQAKAALESRRKANQRQRAMSVISAEEDVEQARAELKSADQNLKLTKETAAEEEERQNLLATQEYERVVASANNKEQTIQLRISKVKAEAATRKRDIEIRLSNITIKNEAQRDSLKEIDSLYNDIKEISIKVGEIKK